ncbi:MAG: hypothetical protein H6697_02760 [Myxococcales bacterium]|nr:hypothetical protein [Myxococcales bacterium]
MPHTIAASPRAGTKPSAARAARTSATLTTAALAAALTVGVVACQPTPTEPPAPEAATATAPGAEPREPTSQPTSMPTAPPPLAAGSGAGSAAPAPDTQHDVEARVAAAAARLQATPAGRVVWAAIEAQGGLQRWYANGPLEFRFTYTPVGGTRPPTDTRQLVDTWSARAVHTVVDRPELRFGWDGQQAWVSDGTAELSTNPRFWSLTPYYFVGLPFVLSDPGVRLDDAGTWSFEGVDWVLVRATFEAGTGDAPDDYYVGLFDPTTSRMRGVRYVVSYPGFFPDGGHSPEKLMMFDGEQTVAGVVLPTSYRTFVWSDGAVTDEVVTNTTLSEVAFRPDTPPTAFDVPAGATVLSGY